MSHSRDSIAPSIKNTNLQWNAIYWGCVINGMCWGLGCQPTLIVALLFLLCLFYSLFFICDTECALLQIRKSKQIQKLATNRRLSSGVGHHSPQTSLSPDRVALSILKKKLAINLLYEAYSISDMIWAQGCQPTSNFCCTCCAFIFEIRFFGCVMAFSQNNTHTFFVFVSCPGSKLQRNA